ncbi:hypothetical protein F4560_001046 [Saccharothrix ecbatanensis]|uniref:Uncharacterized protein n=1 Tax=Saccharothrix ecbatanensis TaxID=1105145 RepID=A0A7W9HG13_9PSEU|nr:hypothetical protein [Saccharothrix ecbatanensis]MBB5801278.1 hypothetical protein [Saccharothrix ecbatanensis]
MNPTMQFVVGVIAAIAFVIRLAAALYQAYVDGQVAARRAGQSGNSDRAQVHRRTAHICLRHPDQH